MSATLPQVEGYFAEQGWTPHGFQRDSWAAQLNGQSGLVQVPTGSGKTWAAYGAALERLASTEQTGLRVLYLTPLRAMSRDLAAALTAPLDVLAPYARLETRTGDTPSHVKQRQMKKPPQVLLTTPESLALMLSYPASKSVFAQLETVIVDEWHELLASKRGVQTELLLARLEQIAPRFQRWALTATVANPEQALAQLTGGQPGVLVQSDIDRPIEMKTLAPPDAATLPWGGHYGLSQLKPVAQQLSLEKPTLVFTNTRGQAETWFEALTLVRFDLADKMALHHGSLDREERERVEAGLKNGELVAVVCTSSLDLGVDFSPVEQVIQIGSIKGMARFLQRAGRASHRPGAACKTLCVPTHALQIFELAAARLALDEGAVEAIEAPREALDVLAQHLVSCALAGGFTREVMLDEIRQTQSFKHLSDTEFDWVLALLERGGTTLSAYPEFHKITCVDGLWCCEKPKVARRHRMSLGTIVSSAQVSVRYVSGQRLGQIEESFVARLKPGDRFQFAGKTLAFVRFKDMVVQVRSARGKRPELPSWGGYRLPITELLSGYLRRVIDTPPADNPEAHQGQPILAAQRRVSHVPRQHETLIERLKDREGHHVFVYPFAGRLAHEGLAAVMAWRLGQMTPATFSTAANDYGFELLSPERFSDAQLTHALSPDELEASIFAALNLGELARREFREVARIAGLVFEGHPGARKSNRQIQTSTGLLYDVFCEHDPDHLLLTQARRQVLAKQFDQSRLVRALVDMQNSDLKLVELDRYSPFSLPLMLERESDRQSSETLEARVARLTAAWS